MVISIYQKISLYNCVNTKQSLKSIKINLFQNNLIKSLFKHSKK